MIANSICGCYGQRIPRYIRAPGKSVVWSHVWAHRLIHLLHQAGAGLNLGPPGKHHFKIKFPHVEPKSCLEQLVLGRNALGAVHISSSGSDNGVLEVLLLDSSCCFFWT